jgi:hypothetical protein
MPRLETLILPMSHQTIFSRRMNYNNLASCGMRDRDIMMLAGNTPNLVNLTLSANIVTQMQIL